MTATIFGAFVVLASALEDESGTRSATNNDDITTLIANLVDIRFTLSV